MASIAEFMASVGFAVDEQSMSGALAKVAGFGAAVAAAAGLAIAGVMRIAEGQVQLAKTADKLGLSIERMEELGYVAEQTGASAEAVASSLAALKEKNPYIKDAGKALEQVGQRMAGMSEQARKLYASRMGIDPALIPMLTQDVSALKGEFAAMYAVAGTDARKAAQDSKAFLSEIGKLKTLSAMLAKAVGLAFVGEIRRDVENLRRIIMENFDKIRRIFEAIIGVVLRVAGVIGAFVTRMVKWGAALVGWYDKLSDGNKKLILGATALLAAWKLLNIGFLATPLGAIITGLVGIVALVDDYQTYMEGGESYFDWGPWADTIEQCVVVLKDVWNAVYAVGAAIFSAAYPALKLLNEQCRWIFNTIASIAEILWKVFSGDFSGALEAARSMFADWAASGQAIISNFCAVFSTLFSTLWSEITTSFPDFAAWAKGVAKAIMDFIAPAVDWIKGKLDSLLGLVPDAIKTKLGIGVKTDSAAKPPPLNTAPPTGPMLTPSHAQAAQIDNSRQQNIKLETKTEINVNGVQDPATVGQKVLDGQKGATADTVRHMKGSTR